MCSIQNIHFRPFQRHQTQLKRLTQDTKIVFFLTKTNKKIFILTVLLTFLFYTSKLIGIYNIQKQEIKS